LKALILAAGFGRRLAPYTRTTPKPLFTLSNQPLLDRVIRKAISAGVTSIKVNTHHLHQQIESYLAQQSYDVPVSTRYEPEILGTGGAIKNLADFWDEHPFLVLNSDIVFNVDLAEFLRSHAGMKALATLMLCDDPQFNQVWVGSDKRIWGFGVQEAPASIETKAMTFTGIQVIHPEILNFIPSNHHYSIIDAYREALTQNKSILACIPRRLVWSDLGSLDRYREAAIHSMVVAVMERKALTTKHAKIKREALAGDGSDRRWYRLKSGDASIIMVEHGIRSASETQEVDAYIQIGRHLSANHVNVPKLLQADPFAGLVFMEDLGDVHLQDIVLQHSANSDAVKRLYHEVVAQLVDMATTAGKRFNPQWAWQSASYDPTVILEKECRYFVEAFLNLYLELPVGFRSLKDEFVFLSEKIAENTYLGFMHRDFQSRNIMIHQNRCWFIDFQGGRIGPLQYDLASLLIDPYVALPQEVVTWLYQLYVKKLSSLEAIDPSVFQKGFEACAITRNLQILGAFGHLSKNKGKDYFETYIPIALRTLVHNIKNTRYQKHLTGLCGVIHKAAMKLEVRTNRRGSCQKST